MSRSSAVRVRWPLRRRLSVSCRPSSHATEIDPVHVDRDIRRWQVRVKDEAVRDLALSLIASETDAKYQPKGNYALSGSSYTKAEIDAMVAAGQPRPARWARPRR